LAAVGPGSSLGAATTADRKADAAVEQQGAGEHWRGPLVRTRRAMTGRAARATRAGKSAGRSADCRHRRAVRVRRIDPCRIVEERASGGGGGGGRWSGRGSDRRVVVGRSASAETRRRRRRRSELREPTCCLHSLSMAQTSGACIVATSSLAFAVQGGALYRSAKVTRAAGLRMGCRCTKRNYAPA
jgi:hypothetical protein